MLKAEAVPEEERPWYLLLLGDLHHVSMELQQVLGHSACVGRLHVGTPGRAGCRGLHGLRQEGARSRAVHRRGGATRAAALHGAGRHLRDGGGAPAPGGAGPGGDARRSGRRSGPRWSPQLLPHDGTSLEPLLRAAGQARAGVLLSVSHGLGRPKKGWASPGGAAGAPGGPVGGPGAGAHGGGVRHTPFLPGGLWFCVACFGAATPDQSAYAAWLSQLAQQGAFPGNVEQVRRSLPQPGERPFVAALPQALLANEQGPLALIGHSDLAWQMSFVDLEAGWRSRASRILGALQVVANGSRVGLGFQALMRAYRETNDSLMAGYQAQEDARLDGTPDSTDWVKQGNLWMLRNDLRGYVLLGRSRGPSSPQEITPNHVSAAIASPIRDSPVMVPAPTAGRYCSVH